MTRTTFLRYWLFLSVSFVLTCVAQSEPNAQLPGQIIVGTKPTDTQERREFVAGKIIIGRSRIEDIGASSVEELLRREPAVSVGADGRIGLLGLPGYTQILVDGEPPMGAKSLDMNLVRVEKIEIIKSNVAEYGPFGIAGTINIITRKAERKTSSNLRLEGRLNGGQLGETFSLSQNQSTEDSPWRFGVQVTAGEDQSRKEERLIQSATEGDPLLREHWQGSVLGRNRNRSADVSLSLEWEPSESESFFFSPSLARLTEFSEGTDRRTSIGGASLVDASNGLTGGLTFVSLPVNWAFRPDEHSQWDIKWNTNVVHFSRSLTRIDSASVPEKLDVQAGEFSAQVSHSLGLGYRTQIAEKNQVKIGASAATSLEDQKFDNRTNGTSSSAAFLFGNSRRTGTQTLSAYAQNEQHLSQSLALNAGVAVESKTYQVSEGEFDSQPSYVVWSPSLHLSKKMRDDLTRQWRMSIARSFKAPDVGSLALRPQISPLAPCKASGICVPNSIDRYDSAGNATLRPEQALGINLSYEHGFGDDSQMTFEVFSRIIDNKHGTAIALENVPWSPTRRYVARPVNLGDARVYGLNIEAELAMKDFIEKDAPKLSVRGNLSFTNSWVSSIDGPDNRLDSQSPWSAKFGASYTMKGAPWKFDLDGNWSPSFLVRVGDNHRLSVARRSEVSASAHWTLAAGQKLTFKVRDVVPVTASRSDEYTLPAGTVRLVNEAQKYSILSVQFSTQL